MTNEQRKTYDTLTAAGYEYSHTVSDRAVIMERKERGAEYERVLETRVIETNGDHYAMPMLSR